MDLRLGKRLTQAILALDRVETRLRTALVGWIRGVPGFLHYKMLKKLSLLREISELLTAARIPYRLTGGFAYDAKRGRLTRYHRDVDFAFLDEQVDAAIAALGTRGFEVIVNTPYAAVAAKDGQHADLFTYRRVGNGFVETMSLEQHGPAEGRCSIIRMPESFLVWDEPAELMGIHFRIVSNEFLASILPLIDDEADRRFIAALPTRLPMTFLNTEGTVQLKLPRREFRFDEEQRRSQD